MEFQYAAELKRRFACYGHFYELLFEDGGRADCRSVLEIVDGAVAQDDPPGLSLREPDAVVVMMNPGSSHPLGNRPVAEQTGYPQAGPSRRKALVHTRPDNTQYQVMRIAVAMGWSHVRVLNLSDLRDPRSGSFLRKVEQLAAGRGGHVHSIFCDERHDECAQALRRKARTPVLLGWGQVPDLVPLARQCLRRLGDEPRCSVASEVHPLLNAHPSPMLQSKKLEWLQGMLRALAGSGSEAAPPGHFTVGKY